MLLTPDLARRALAELIGTALLLIAVVGSGIAAASLSPSDTGLQLLENAMATAAAFAVGAYIGGAYFFTASTSFANPAVTVARTLSDTFAGIAPTSAPAFVVAQVAGAALAVAAVRVLYPAIAEVAPEVVVPKQPRRTSA